MKRLRNAWLVLIGRKIAIPRTSIMKSGAYLQPYRPGL